MTTNQRENVAAARCATRFTVATSYGHCHPGAPLQVRLHPSLEASSLQETPRESSCPLLVIANFRLMHANISFVVPGVHTQHTHTQACGHAASPLSGAMKSLKAWGPSRLHAGLVTVDPKARGPQQSSRALCCNFAASVATP